MSVAFRFRNPPLSHTCNICDFFSILSSLCLSSVTCHWPSVWLSLALDCYSWSVPFGWICRRWLTANCVQEAYFSISVSWGLKPICSVAYHWWCGRLEFLRWWSGIEEVLNCWGCWTMFNQQYIKLAIIMSPYWHYPCHCPSALDHASLMSSWFFPFILALHHVLLLWFCFLLSCSWLSFVLLLSSFLKIISKTCPI